MVHSRRTVQICREESLSWLHLFEEIRDVESNSRPLNDTASSSSSFSWFSDLTLTIQAAKRLLSAADNFDSKISSVSSNPTGLHSLIYVYSVIVDICNTGVPRFNVHY